MLNEIGEFEQYTAPCGKRLKYGTLIKGNFSGLERAMTIIARRVIFGLNDEPRRTVEEARDCLKIWLGFKTDENPLVPTGWLPAYIGNLTPQTAKINDRLEELPKKDATFDRSVFRLTEKEFRAITYDRVIANALILGKLRRYYLVCNFKADDDVFKSSGILSKRKKSRDLVLKLTAFYLLQRRLNDQEWVPFNQMNFMNWLTSATKPENWKLDEFTFRVKPLFERISVTSLKVVKLKVNPIWLENFSLAEESKLPENFGGIFFSDTAAVAPLAENRRYQQ